MVVDKSTGPDTQARARGAPPFPLQLFRETCGRAQSLGLRGVVFSTLLAVLFYSMVCISTLVPDTRQRFDGTRLLTFGDVRFQGDGTALLQVKWAKNAQHAGQGFAVPLLLVMGCPACPIENLRRLFRLWATVEPGRPLFAFPSRKRGTGAVTQGFTINLARVWFSTLLRAQGVPAGTQGYTLQRGACSLAFRNGAVESDLQALGGWRSSAVRCYYAASDARRRAAKALADSY